MAITVSPVSNNQTFGAWLTTTNRLVELVSQNVVTADSSNSGSVTSGNTTVNGHFGATFLYTTTLSGGGLGNTGILTIASNTAVVTNTGNTTFTGGAITITNASTNTSIVITAANSAVIANGSFFLNANGSFSVVAQGASGSNTQIQFNDSNNFAGSADFTFNSANNRLTVGNSTVNAAVTSSDYQIANSTVSFALGLPTAAQYANGAFFLNANGDWSEVSGGGGYYKGNAGTVGNPTNAGNLFRINANTLTANVTMSAGENAQVTGPISIANGVVLTIDSDSRVVVI